MLLCSFLNFVAGEHTLVINIEKNGERFGFEVNSIL